MLVPDVLTFSPDVSKALFSGDKGDHCDIEDVYIISARVIFLELATEMATPATRKTVELFYDVVSPYTWFAFEVRKFVFITISDVLHFLSEYRFIFCFFRAVTQRNLQSELHVC